VPTLITLDPKELAAHPSNPRLEPGNLKELTASIAQVGVIQPVVVKAVEGGHQLLAGSRRLAAAVAAGVMLPAICVENDDEASLVLTMLAENTQRKALTVAEEARAHQMLLDLGISATKITKATGAKAKDIKSAATLVGSEVASAVTHRYELTLDEGLVIAEFADDNEAVKALVAAAKDSHGQFLHMAERLRRDRDRKAEIAKLTAELVEAGVTVVEDPPRYDAKLSDPNWVDALADEKGNLTDRRHAKCPGHAAVVQNGYQISVRYLCLDPKANGHKKATSGYSNNGSSGPKTEDDVEAERQKRREVIANNKAMDAAITVRHAFVAELFARKTPIDGALAFAVNELAIDPGLMGGERCEKLIAGWFGTTPGTSYTPVAAREALAKVSPRTQVNLLLAMVAAGIESRSDKTDWRRSCPALGRWIAFLVTQGYEPAEVEQLVIDGAKD
jgi:ParB family chromosome partitioning protein